MQSITRVVRRVVHPAIRNGWYTLWMQGQWRLTPAGMISRLRLRRLRGQHQGQRCVILGNGPSLREMDLQPLRHEYTFGLNRIYLLFPQMGFQTTYFVSLNPYVLEQCTDEITALALPRFLAWSARRYIPLDQHTIFLQSCPVPNFATNPARCVWEGHTVTYVALQLAYYMGFTQVILIGVDHSFSTSGTPNSLIVSDGDDPDHFAADYFGAGFRWQLPDLETSEKAYRLARDMYVQDGREILDATVGGKLRVFPRVDYATLFKQEPE